MLWLGFGVLILAYLHWLEASGCLRLCLRTSRIRCLDLRAEHLHLGSDGFPHNMTAARDVLRLVGNLLRAALVHIILVADYDLMRLLWLVLVISDVHLSVLCDLCL